MQTNFDKVIEEFMNSNELGDYSKELQSITLYDILNTKDNIARIRKRIEKITNKFKLIVLSKDTYTNIKILDINL